jgi:hypothetical protein
MAPFINDHQRTQHDTIQPSQPELDELQSHSIDELDQKRERRASMRHGLIATILFAIALAGPESRAANVEIWVASQGNDANPGTEASPRATLAGAQKAVRQRVAAGLAGDVVVTIRGGTYELTEPLVFGPEDSGAEKFSVTYRAAPGENVVVSGGSQITGWKPGADGSWTASVPGVKEGKWYFRHLFVNDRRALRARLPNADAADPYWQLAGAELSADGNRYTFSLNPEGLMDWKSVGDVEVVVFCNWEITRKRLERVDPKSGVVILAPPHAPMKAEALRPGPGRWCYFENARAMLDQPGEWYLDRATGILNYKPRPGEELAQARVTAPRLACLVKVKGTPERPVRNLHFRGLHFAHTDWTLPKHGYVGMQACHYSVGQGEEDQEGGDRWPVINGAIQVEDAVRVTVEDGSVSHLGSSGIQIGPRCRNCAVQGNVLADIAGNGVMVSGPNAEAEVPVDVRVCNNHVYDCGIGQAGAVGIWVGFARGTVVAHNLVHGLPYTGISVGWQWNPKPSACRANRIEYNHVYDVMNRLCDGGCIYTLGYQPDTVIRGNHLHGVKRNPLAQGAPNNGMFIDEGSKGYLFEQNVIYSTADEQVRFNQCSRDWHTWRDNHFGEPAAVQQSGKETIAKAGPEPEYRRRLRLVP